MSHSTEPEQDADGPAETRRPVRAIAASLGLTAAGIFASLVGGIAFVVPLFLLGLDVQSVPLFLALAAVGELGYLAVAYAYARYADLRVRTAVPDGRDLGYAVAGLAAMLVLALGLAVLLQSVGLLPTSVIDEVGEADPTLYLGLAVLSVVLVAPAEEFLFRGVIQTRLRRAFGPVGAIAWASLLFGSIHLANYSGSVAPIVAGTLLIVVVGAVLGTLYELTGNLTVPILAHGAYNVVAMSIAFLGG